MLTPLFKTCIKRLTGTIQLSRLGPLSEEGLIPEAAEPFGAVGDGTWRLRDGVQTLEQWLDLNA
jgi:hypothetical protein